MKGVIIKMDLNSDIVKEEEEVLLWFDHFLHKTPSDSRIIYYSVKDFLSMLSIVTKNSKQFGGKTFKNIDNNRKHNCYQHFKNYFMFPSFCISYFCILREWISRYTTHVSSSKNIKNANENENSDSKIKMLPFTEDIIFFLFNFFASHGKCLAK